MLVDGEAVKSCLMFAAQADGQRVTTVESLATERGAASAAAGVQGRARPAVRLLHARVPDDGDRAGRRGRELERARSSARSWPGVICRCTGYENIVTAVERYLDERDGRSMSASMAEVSRPPGRPSRDRHRRQRPPQGGRPPAARRGPLRRRRRPRPLPAHGGRPLPVPARSDRVDRHLGGAGARGRRGRPRRRRGGPAHRPAQRAASGPRRAGRSTSTRMADRRRPVRGPPGGQRGGGRAGTWPRTRSA